MKHIVVLILGFCLVSPKLFAQDTTDIEKPLEADSLQVAPIDSLQTIDTVQNNAEVDSEETSKKLYYLVKKAHFKQGDSVFVRKVRERLTYPEEGRKYNFTTTLIVKFIVSKEATISDIQIVEGFPEDIEAHFRQDIEDKIKSVIQEVSQEGWEPATNNFDQKVAMRKTLPITFSPYRKN